MRVSVAQLKGSSTCPLATRPREGSRTGDVYSALIENYGNPTVLSSFGSPRQVHDILNALRLFWGLDISCCGSVDGHRTYAARFAP